MTNAAIFVSLAILFYFLGKSADLIVLNIRKIGERLGIKIFFLGLILGFLTSLPEFSVGVNAITQNLPEIPMGNLLGGIIVLFGLILGASLVLNRRITTDGKISSFLPILIYIALPFAFGLDNKISSFEGFVIILAYFLIIFRLYLQNKNNNGNNEKIQIAKKEFFKKLSTVLLGFVLLIVISNLIIQLTIALLNNLGIPILAAGILIFSLGTNLPEIIVTFRSWRRHIKELSISTLIGSALANPAIIGIFSLIKPINFTADLSYYLLMAFTLLLLVFLLRFYETNKALTKREGFFLISIYLAFLLTQVLFLVYSKWKDLTNFLCEAKNF